MKVKIFKTLKFCFNAGMVLGVLGIFIVAILAGTAKDNDNGSGFSVFIFTVPVFAFLIFLSRRILFKR